MNFSEGILSGILCSAFVFCNRTINVILENWDLKIVKIMRCGIFIEYKTYKT